MQSRAKYVPVATATFPLWYEIAFMVGESPGVDVDGSGDSGALEVDAVFDVLGDRRRRHVISCLLEEDRAIALWDLARIVAHRESDRPGGEIDRESVAKIQTSLYHVHVPKLAAAGVVEYDRDRDLVRAATGAERIDRAASLADGVVAHDTS